MAYELPNEEEMKSLKALHGSMEKATADLKFSKVVLDGAKSEWDKVKAQFELVMFKIKARCGVPDFYNITTEGQWCGPQGEPVVDPADSFSEKPSGLESVPQGE